jgi:Type II secretion system (T2SS), protein G
MLQALGKTLIRTRQFLGDALTWRQPQRQYPSADVGLKALVEAPAEAPRWNGPYIKKAQNLVAPWGATQLRMESTRSSLLGPKGERPRRLDSSSRVDKETI